MTSVLLVMMGLLGAADAGSLDGGARVDAGVKAPPDAGVAAKSATLTPEVKALVDRVQSFYEKTTDFSSGFTQDYTYKAFKRTQTSSGTVTYRKPALMRWEYTKPSPRTFVLAGDKVFAYDPEAKLLTKAAIGTAQLSASVTFLWGQGKLADEFAIVARACKAPCTTQVLELTPLRPDPRFRQVLLEVDLASAQVRKSTVTDPDGSQNAITFTDLKTNTGIGEESFKLKLPADTQVQDFTAGSSLPDAGSRPARVEGQ
jgi:outer membrane lipoprotein carrier protein